MAVSSLRSSGLTSFCITRLPLDTQGSLVIPYPPDSHFWKIYISLSLTPSLILPQLSKLFLGASGAQWIVRKSPSSQCVFHLLVLTGSPLRTLFPLQSSIRLLSLISSLESQDLEQDRCSLCFFIAGLKQLSHLPPSKWPSLKLVTLDCIICHFHVGNYLLTPASLPLFLAHCQFLHHYAHCILGAFNIHIDESSSTLSVHLLDLRSSKHLILHPSSAIHSHSHTRWPCPHQELLTPPES